MALSEEERKITESDARYYYKLGTNDAKAYREANPCRYYNASRYMNNERMKAWTKANTRKIIIAELRVKRITDPPEELIELLVARRELKRNFKELNERIKEYDSNGTGISRE